MDILLIIIERSSAIIANSKAILSKSAFQVVVSDNPSTTAASTTLTPEWYNR